MRITSRQNPTIKFVAKLKMKKYRDKTRQMLVEGWYLISFAVQNKYPIEQLFICPSLFSDKFDNQALIDTLKQLGALITEVSEIVFSKIGCSDNPSGLLAIITQKPKYLKDCRVAGDGLYVAVESIEQPHNLGAVIRLADNAGAHGVLVCNMRADLYDPETIRSSFGALFSIDTLLCSTTEAVLWCNDHHLKIVATSPTATVGYGEIDMTGPTVIVMGAEHGGLGKEWLAKANAKVLIPMYGQANSLSVSAATAVVLYEALRQRKVEPRNYSSLPTRS